MLIALALFFVGLFLSAFFSGSETGFYRASRVRLVLDAMGGDPIARGLIRLSNRPSLFVATSLVGNNLANYLASLAIVLAVQQLPFGSKHVMDLVAPIALAPLVFVYGELLPKALYFDAPNRLLRRSGPLFLVCTLLFLPLSALLWAMGRILQSVIGEQPLRTQLKLARQELGKVIEEGQHAGVLRPLQVQLTQAVTALGSEPISKFAKPVTRVGSVPLGAPASDVIRLARRQGSSLIPVRKDSGHGLIGYVRVVDLHLSGSSNIESPRELMRLPEETPLIAAITHMQRQKEELACVTNEGGEIVSLLYIKDLIEPLFRAHKPLG